MEITLEEIQKKFDSLPEDLKWAIMAAKVDDNIIEIAKEQGLNVEMMGQLSLETHMVMFGFTPLEKFEESVQKSMGLPELKTKAVVEAVNEKILREIRRKMMEQSGEKMPPTPVSKSQPSQNATAGQVDEPKEEVQKVSEEDKKVLNSVGIKIEGEEAPIETKKEPAKEELHPILTQKMTEPVKNEVRITKHLEEIGNPAGEIPKTVPQKPTIDPYRELPE